MFNIDTGSTIAPNVFATDRADLILQAAKDSLPADAEQGAIDAAIVSLVMGELRTPKTLETVRRRLLQLWPLIQPLATREPEQFDAILMEFAELTTAIG